MAHEPEINYSILPLVPNKHMLEVQCTIAQPITAGQILKLPAWVPGSYKIRDFAKNIVSLHAKNKDQDILVTKIDKHTWQCEPCKGPLTIHYKIYLGEFSPRGSYMDHHQVFITGAQIFLQVVGQEESQHDLAIAELAEKKYRAWKVATTMPVKKINKKGFGRYLAENYFAVIDHPIAIGSWQELDFTVQNIPHQIVLTGSVLKPDLERLTHDVAKICAQHAAMFGDNLPFEQYKFLVNIIPNGYGGIEYRACSVLECGSEQFPVINNNIITKDYRSLLGLFSHEYFHLWNVKRIKPQAFAQPDLTHEVYTKDLWICEGITSYYDDLALVRSKIIGTDSYLELLAATITRVFNLPGHTVQTLAESSFDAWIKFYQPDCNTPNVVVSYYTKGSLVALVLDLTIRQLSNNQHNLDQIMQAMWLWHAANPEKGFVPGDFEKLTCDITGLNLHKYFVAWIYGTEMLPLANIFAYVGIEYKLQAPEGTSLGVKLSDLKLTCVYTDSAAEVAGLMPQDELIAINNIKVTSKDLQTMLNRFSPGDEINIHVFRRGELLKFELILDKPIAECKLKVMDDATDVQQTMLRSWLS